MKEKLRVLWVSDLVTPTGFSMVAHNIINNNMKEWEVTGLGINYRGDPHVYPYNIFPAMISGMGNIYGVDRLVQLLTDHQFDLVYILNDSWVISYYLDAVKKNVKTPLPKFVVYFPVDSRFHNPDWYKDFDIVSKAFTYTEFGKKVVQECRPDLEIGIIPHGVDTEDFYKISDSREEVRQALWSKSAKDGRSLKDLFIVLNAGRNQPRKRLDITIAGFAMFAYGKPQNVKLHMHTGVRDSAVDVPYLCRRYGIEDRLILTNLNHGVQKVPMTMLNQIYNAADVGINTGLGEGWGLPNMEHAVTGAVQVVPRHSACEELYGDCGLLMETVTDYTFDNSQTVGKLTTPREVARCLNLLYENPELRQEMSNKCMEKFLQPKYSWKEIAKQWREVFLDVTSVAS